MATEDTVQLSQAHAPHQASIDAVESVLQSVKDELVKLRRDHDSTLACLRSSRQFLTHAEHEPEYFSRIRDVSDADLISFKTSDLDSVRVAASAYGLHIFGKIQISAIEDAYVHIRIFGSAKEGTDGGSLDERDYKLHSIHTEEVVKADGDRIYRAIFSKSDPLEWFDT